MYILMMTENPQEQLNQKCAKWLKVYTEARGKLILYSTTTKPLAVVRHVTGTGSGLLGEIPRVVVQISALT
jgi:hypothetical protein